MLSILSQVLTFGQFCSWFAPDEHTNGLVQSNIFKFIRDSNEHDALSDRLTLLREELSCRTCLDLSGQELDADGIALFGELLKVDCVVECDN